MRFMRTILAVLFLCAPPAAARADYDAAMLAYESGRYGVALGEFRPLSARGDPRAEFMLGVMRFHGRGAPRNDGFAAIWFHKAATQGHPGAQLAYGSLHIRGVGVAQDLTRAYMWLSLAADSGVPGLRQQAVSLRDDVARLMNPERIAEARSRARKWKPTPAGLWIER